MLFLVFYSAVIITAWTFMRFHMMKANFVNLNKSDVVSGVSRELLHFSI